MKSGILFVFLSFVLNGCGIGEPNVLYDEVFSLKGGTTKTKSFSIEEARFATLEIVSSDPSPVNVYLIPESDNDNFLNARAFDYITPFKMQGVHRKKITSQLNGGDYAIGLIQSDFSNKSPTKVHLKLTFSKYK